MWLVEVALKRPYTVAVMAALIVLGGALSLTRMIVDVFPAIDIPVVAVVWNYPGLPAEDMERRVVVISERAYSTTVNGIERIDSQSIPGVGLLKVYFQPGTEIGAAIAQMAAVSNTILRILPPGMQPPSVIQFNASNIPVAQLTVSSEILPEQKIFDYGLNFIRIKLFTIPGLSSPAPFGGKGRQVNVDLDLEALTAKGLSAADVVNALSSSNVILPAGVARLADHEYMVTMNSSPKLLDQFNTIPVRVSDGVPVMLGDVAHISDGFADQTNIVHVNGKRATYLAILKHADASTLAVVDAVREALPGIKAAAPDGLELKIDFDQSLFVRGAIKSVLSEAILSSILVSLMIGVFLGSWRSMVIVCTSIPLAIFAAIVGLKLTDNSINIMTLGGLSLAIGMLVDDATVEVENIHRNRGLGKPLTVAILDGARQIAVPAIVATLSICIVFFPVVLLVGPAKYLFTPLALAVVLAMLASYILSRTLVPVLARLLMGSEHVHGAAAGPHKKEGYGSRFNKWRDQQLHRLQSAYGRLLVVLLTYRKFALTAAAVVAVVSLGLLRIVGTDFFPTVDAGLMKLHFRAPPGVRIERTEDMVAAIEQRISKIIPAAELETINDMIGVPLYYNLAFIQTDNVGAMDAEILISLRPHHRPSREYREILRQTLSHEFPGCTFYFQPADIISQVLNFGLSAPIDIQIEGANLDNSFEIARQLVTSVKGIPGLVDVHLTQVLDYPTLRFEVDRLRAAQLGLVQRDVASNMLVSLSSSSLLSPSYYLNPVNSVNYPVVVKAPLTQVNSVSALSSTPLASGAGAINAPVAMAALAALPHAPSPTLGAVSELQPSVSPNQISHSTIARVLDVTASVEGRDLGSVSADIAQKIAALGKLPTGVRVAVRGQNVVMEQSFRSLGLGLAIAIALVYCLMVVLFQSWLDPLLIMIAVPGALVGILWMLAVTHTTLNVESLMGAIMAVGIAVSNSILIVNHANEARFDTTVSASAAALDAGTTRLRPVIMTALAMIIGMVPMALGLGEAGEQNAPLGRAVIGGLLMATVVTLFVVPLAYATLRKRLPTKHLLDERFAAERAGLDPQRSSL